MQGILDRIHPAWPSSSDDAVQDLRLHHNGSRPLLHPGFKARPVHENPMAFHVHGADYRYYMGLHRASRGPRMGSWRRHRGCLHRAPGQQIQLPQWPRLFQRFRYLGSHRSSAHLLPRFHLRQPPMVLDGGRSRPGPFLRPRSRLPPRPLPLPLRSSNLRRQRRNPAGHPAQLPCVGPRGLRLQ